MNARDLTIVSLQGLESFLLLGREHGNFELRALEKEIAVL